MNKTIFSSAVFLLLSVFLCEAKKVKISGYIVDKKDGECLIGANINIGKKWAVTNNYGFFSISADKGESSIQISYIGYSPYKKVIDIKRDTTITIRLSQNAEIAETVITGSKSIRATYMGVHDIPVDIIKNTPTPLGEADVLKTIQLLPGVQSSFSGSAGIIVRGGGIDENMYLLDGVPIYNISHLLGLFSAFTPEAIKKVVIYKGSFPARFGGRVSSIVDIRTKDGNFNETHGTVSVGLLNDKFHIEGPLKKGIASYYFSIRGMHSAIFTPIIKLAKSSLNYYYYDINGKVNYKISEKDKLFFSIYHGNDHLNYNNNKLFLNRPGYNSAQKIDADMNWGNTVSSLNWNHIFNTDIFTTTSLSYNRYGMKSENIMTEKLEKATSNSVSRINDFNLNCDLEYIVSEWQDLHFGVAFTYHNFMPLLKVKKQEISENQQTFKPLKSPALNGTETTAYAEGDIKFNRYFSLNLGLRYTVMTANQSVYTSTQPRGSFMIGFGKGFSFKGSYAKMAQYVHLLSSSNLSLPSDLWIPITGKIKPLMTDNFSFGGYYEYNNNWELSIEGYYKRFKNIIEYKDGVPFWGAAINWEDMTSLGIGRSYGIEFHLQKKLGKATGWISYTLSKTERRFPDNTINNGKWFPAKYDRTHNLTIFANYQFTPNIDLSATWNFISGNMTTLTDRMTLAGQFLMGKHNQNKPYTSYIYTTSSKNNYRLPPSHSLSINMNFRKHHKRGGESIWSIGIYNIYNSKNPDVAFTKQVYIKSELIPIVKYELTTVTYLPILPSFSYTFRF